jgi:hypothetical protein
VRRGGSRRRRRASVGRRALGTALALLALVAGLAACTGTREARTPLAVVVGGDDGGGRIELIASPLPPEPGGERGELTLLPGFGRDLPGTLVDLAVARDAPVRLYALHRDGSDLLSRFDVDGLDLDDPSSLPATPRTIDLGRRVADAGVLPEPSSLCAAGLAVSADGRWAAVVHVPASCGDGTDDTSNVLLVELTPDPGEAPVVVPEAPSTDDAPGTPTFVTRDGEELLAWPLRSGDVVGLALEAPRDPRLDLAEADVLSDVLDAARGGLGLVVVDDERAVSVPLGGGEPSRSWEAPAGVTFVAAVDASGLPGPVAIVRGEDELVVIPDVSAPSGEGEPGEAAVRDARDAVVDPYGYAFVASDDRLAAVDVLSYLAAPDGRPSTVLTAALDAPAQPRAVTWLFAPGGAPEPATAR